MKAPVSLPTGHTETWRYSSAEEPELMGFDGGLQGHRLVQLSSKHRARCDTALHNRGRNRMLVEQGSPCCKQLYLSPDFTTKENV